MIILGIDPGYGRLGCAVLKKESKQEELLDFFCIETNPKKTYYERILEITNKIEKTINEYKPDTLAIEKVYFTNNQKTALNVSEVKGVIIYLALKNGMEIHEYTPLEIKSAVCGYGKATKEQVKKMVALLLNVKEEIKNDDTIDAIAICLTCSAQKNIPK
ncbi:crossover junction endodeoxyribonuclease RuvC [Patescibacteria group bacterium]|nr:crossover junction endodeoxyribonuclease RuvC [Patescibacteria group bacterium]